MNILITGCSGFIGFHLCKSLLEKKHKVLGLDNLNGYYSVKLKKKRLSLLKKKKNFKFFKIDISDYNKLNLIFKKNKINLIINLAAQAGVRYSIMHPKEYMDSNILGLFNIFEMARIYNVSKVLYASSSSVYGEQKNYPVNENVNLLPKNIYALSKKNNEEIAEIYFNYYRIKSIGLRFFTVYGEWGRPDMLMLKYMLAKYNKKIFTLNNYGNHYRDFTYIQDVIKILNKIIPTKFRGHDILNICSNKPYSVKKILKFLDQNYGKPKIKHQKKLNVEVLKTHGSNAKLIRLLKFKNFTNIEIGMKNLIIWAKSNINII